MRGIYAYIVRRLLIAIPMLLGVTVLIFSIMHLIPGDPLDYMLRGRPVTPETLELMKEKLGLKLPLHVQYLRYMGGLLRGDWGESIRTKVPVLTELSTRYVNTLQLAVLGIAISLLIGIPLGVIAAVKQNSVFDYLSMIGALFGVSIPGFWFAIVLIMMFSVGLHWLPASGNDSVLCYIMPALTVGLGGTGFVARLTRSSMLEVLRQDYVRTARAKGLRERIVVYKHALKNAIIPVITMVGIQFGYLLGGTVIIEMVFAWPGIGRLLVVAVWAHDIPVIQGCALSFTLIFILISLTVDIAYAYLNPQIRYE